MAHRTGKARTAALLREAGIRFYESGAGDIVVPVKGAVAVVLSFQRRADGALRAVGVVDETGTRTETVGQEGPRARAASAPDVHCPERKR